MYCFLNKLVQEDYANYLHFRIYNQFILLLAFQYLSTIESLNCDRQRILCLWLVVLFVFTELFVLISFIKTLVHKRVRIEIGSRRPDNSNFEMHAFAQSF